MGRPPPRAGGRQPQALHRDGAFALDALAGWLVGCGMDRWSRSEPAHFGWLACHSQQTPQICNEPDPAKRDLGTSVANALAIAEGAAAVRVHNVPAAVQAARLADAIARRL
jgi:hypothetical protein